MNTHLAAELAARAGSAPDAALRLVAAVGSRPESIPTMPPLTGAVARKVASMSARWAVAVIATCEDHDTQRQLLASERRSTVQAAACTNVHLAPDLVLDLLRWAVEGARTQEVWSLVGIPGVPLEDVVSELARLSDGPRSEFASLSNVTRWSPARFTEDDVRFAVGSPNAALAATALAAVADGDGTASYRTWCANEIAARGDCHTVIRGALTFDYTRPWDVDIVGPMVRELVPARRLVRSAVRYTDDAIVLLWREVLESSDDPAADIRPLPVCRAALELAAVHENALVAAEAASRIWQLSEGLDTGSSDATAGDEPGGLDELASRLADRMDHTLVGYQRQAVTNLLGFPLTCDQTAAVLRCGNGAVTAKWFSGYFGRNLPTGQTVTDLVADPGLCVRNRLVPSRRRIDDSLEAFRLPPTAPDEHVPGAMEAFRDAVAHLPGALNCRTQYRPTHSVALDVLASRLTAMGAPPEAWELAAVLGEDWDGTVNDLVDVITATS